MNTTDRSQGEISPLPPSDARPCGQESEASNATTGALKDRTGGTLKLIQIGPLDV